MLGPPSTIPKGRFPVAQLVWPDSPDPQDDEDAMMAPLPPLPTDLTVDQQVDVALSSNPILRIIQIAERHMDIGDMDRAAVLFRETLPYLYPRIGAKQNAQEGIQTPVLNVDFVAAVSTEKPVETTEAQTLDGQGDLKPLQSLPPVRIELEFL